MTSLKSPSELKKLCEEVLALDGKATKGVWTQGISDRDASFVNAGEAVVCKADFGHPKRPIKHEANAALIAHYRTAAPALARAYLAATKRLEEADKALVHFANIGGSVAPSWKIGIATENAVQTYAEPIEAARSRLARQQGEQR